MGANATGKTTWDCLAMSRTDYLSAKIIRAIAVVGPVSFGVGAPVFDTATHAPPLMSYPTKVASGIELPRGAIPDGNATATVELRLKDATLVERLVQAIPGLLLSAMTIRIALLLFLRLRSAQAGRPFSTRNMRIITIALIVGLGGMLAQSAAGLADKAFQTTGRLPNLKSVIVVMTLNPLPLVVMLVILLVGEAFRRGLVLRHDVEGLV